LDASRPLEIRERFSGAVLFDARGVEQVGEGEKTAQKNPRDIFLSRGFGRHPKLEPVEA
jgi:hypothetical protein